MQSGVRHVIAGPVGLGIICGLAFGKPIGISLFAWVVTRMGVARLASGVRWRHVIGVGALGGIGFTMSIFIANLAFGPTEILEAAKVAILAASLLSGIGGAIILLKKSPF